jgi:hypothetical protein
MVDDDEEYDLVNIRCIFLSHTTANEFQAELDALEYVDTQLYCKRMLYL